MAKIFPRVSFGKIFRYGDWWRIFSRAKESGNEDKSVRGPWLWEHTRLGTNASRAARLVYGGTPITSVRLIRMVLTQKTNMGIQASGAAQKYGYTPKRIFGRFDGDVRG